MTRTDDEDTPRQFDQIVDMTPAELRRWLDTDESKSVGQKHRHLE